MGARDWGWPVMNVKEDVIKLQPTAQIWNSGTPYYY